MTSQCLYVLMATLDTKSKSAKIVLRMYFMYGLLTKSEVKMAGYWPSSFFLRVYGPRRSRGP